MAGQFLLSSFQPDLYKNDETKKNRFPAQNHACDDHLLIQTPKDRVIFLLFDKCV